MTESHAQTRDNIVIYLLKCYGRYFDNDENNSSHKHAEVNSAGCSCRTGCHKAKSIRDTKFIAYV